MLRKARIRLLAALVIASQIPLGAINRAPKKMSPAILSAPMVLELPIMPLPKLPPKLAWLTIPPPGLKKASNPHKARARVIPPNHQFQRLEKKWGCHIAKITAPRARAIIAKPAPNCVSRLCQVVMPHPASSCQNRQSNTTTIITAISLLIGGEVRRLKKRLHVLFLCLGWDLIFLLAMTRCLYFNSYRHDHRSAPSFCIEKFSQNIFYFSVDGFPLCGAFLALFQCSYE